MKIRIAVIKTSETEYLAYGEEGKDDTELINYIFEDIGLNIHGDVYFVEVELPPKPPCLVGEVVL